MNNKILFLSVVTSALLAACGGGGGDKNSTATSSGGNSGSQTTAPSNTFTVKAQYKDACGNVAPAPNASLLVHDAEFNTEQVVNADANGVISYSSQSATKNLSILIPGQTALANGVTPVTLSTYIDQPLSDLGEYSALTFNDSQCECKTISEVIVSAPLRPFDRPDSFVMSGSTSVNSAIRGSEDTRFEGVKICRSADEQWPKISAMLKFRWPDEAFATFIDDYSADTITKELDLTGKPVSVVTEPQNTIQISARAGDSSHFRNHSFDPQVPIFAFESPDVDYQSLRAYQYTDLPISSGITSAYMLNSAIQRFTEVESSYALDAMDIQYQALLSILDDSAATYDLTAFTDVDLVYIRTTATGEHGEVLYWSMRAPASGSVPSLENINISNVITDQQLAQSTTDIRMSVAAYDYQGITSYEDYTAKVNDRKTAADEVKPEWSRLKQASVVINADESFITASGQRPTLATKLLGVKTK